MADVGLSFRHISPQGPVSTAQEGPTFEVAVGATFAKLKGKGNGGGGGPGRGVVNGFSAKSRKRLMDLFNQIQRSSLESGLFITLTFPDTFSGPAEAKKQLDTWMKRLQRKHPKAVAVWRMEFVKRKSGVNAGLVAPHFHVVVLAVDWMDLQWLGRSWFEVVGSGDEKHLFAGTQAQRIRSKNGIKYYAAKYMSKEAVNPAGWTGRVWGVYGRGLLPIILETLALTWDQFYKMRRQMRKWVSKQIGRKVRWGRGRGQGFTAYLGDGASFRLLAWVLASA